MTGLHMQGKQRFDKVLPEHYGIILNKYGLNFILNHHSLRGNIIKYSMLTLIHEFSSKCFICFFGFLTFYQLGKVLISCCNC